LNNERGGTGKYSCFKKGSTMLRGRSWGIAATSGPGTRSLGVNETEGGSKERYLTYLKGKSRFKSAAKSWPKKKEERGGKGCSTQGEKKGKKKSEKTEKEEGKRFQNQVAR